MIIDGKQIANALKQEIRERVQAMAVKPKVSAIILGEHPSSMSYLKMLEKTCKAIEFDYEIVSLPLAASLETLLKIIDEKNNDSQIKGILVQLPLPEHIDASKVLDAIVPEKDLDGFHPLNAGHLFKGERGIRPCTPTAVMYILAKMGIELKGKDVVVIGRSNIVGKPLSMMLLEQNATVTICHSKTKALASHTKRADIIIVAVGVPNFLTKEMVTEASIVIDVGTNMLNGKLVGDADFEALKDYVKMITPVPGGVGPVTNAVLLNNALMNS
ncbi:MAG: methylenetetrahydrofolate dehydrogenase / methenyltetrahydrofolate cyclohydrolase [Clostridiales bacterium]|jgi:methylenetetrahydrofolate dehydrogenase (NADP+)/methenyltetrahydrofolate cyclohydrolase|nr:methylenetetrahydrofolate dehydrogenase / methenyltetrahydrofolate cyclohydrolase [Clostridiales bacterium]MDN5298735.1 methylenetetrahydrofolate dehydrogenase / methenyltetrahydrofolate cyclohydrolase [Clostridiales bacterium]